MPTPKSPPSPPDGVTDARREWAATRGAPGDCCVYYEALAAPMVLLGNYPHRLHLPCYATLRVRAATDLRCPACRATEQLKKPSEQLPTAQRKGFGRGDGDRTTRDAG